MIDRTVSHELHECPYCGAPNTPHVDDYAVSHMKCAECGKVFLAEKEVEITYKSYPRCNLNGQEHIFAPGRYSTVVEVCEICGHVRVK